MTAYLAGGAARTAAKAPATRLATARAPAAPQLTPTPAALRLEAPRPAAPAAARIARAEGALDCLTDAVYYESRGETDRGQAAVAQVVLNRVRRAGFPKSICGVVFQGAAQGACQFSFACDGAMRQAREPAAWRRARVVAQRALDGFVMEEVGDATNFHVARLGQIWGSGLVKVAQVGAHVFYRLTGHGTFVAHGSGGRSASPPDDVRELPADGGDQASLILASAVTMKPLGEGGPVGPVSEPASAPAAATPVQAKTSTPPSVAAKPSSPAASKAPASAIAPVGPVATAPKAEG